MRKIVNIKTGEVTEDVDAPVIPLSTEEVKSNRKAEIISALENIDRKSIRSIREGDFVRIQVWENQAAALRAELAGLNG